MIKNIVLSALLLFAITSAYAAMPATIKESGTWDALNSFQVIQATINKQNEKVCLPTVEFTSKVDMEQLQTELKTGIQKQEAIFNLYHDGIGRPKKQGGMLYASDVYLKDLKMTYTGFLSKLGYKFTVSNKPAYEDPEALKNIVYSRGIDESKRESDKKRKEEEKEKARKQRKEKPPTRRIETIYDVLPPGVIPPATRKDIAEINRRIENMKNRPYETKDVEIDPVRWASGVCGLLKEDGTITGAKVEGRKPQIKIRVPDTKGWLTPAMIKELEGARCEFMLQRDYNGHEVTENGAYLVRDLYLHKLKLNWEEWLEKHGLKCPDFENKSTYAQQPIVLDTEYLPAMWVKTLAIAACGVSFPKKNVLVKEKEMLRVFPPEVKPVNFKNYAKAFDEKYSNCSIGVTLLICPDNKPYTELGQKRALRVYFSDAGTNLDVLQKELIKEQNKKK